MVFSYIKLDFNYIYHLGTFNYFTFKLNVLVLTVLCFFSMHTFIYFLFHAFWVKGIWLLMRLRYIKIYLLVWQLSD